MGENFMSLVPEEHKTHIKEQLQANMKDPVRLIVFTQEMECEFCKESRELVLEVASFMPDKIKVEGGHKRASELARHGGAAPSHPLRLRGQQKDYGIRY